MFGKGDVGENLVYLAVAVFVILIVVYAVFFSGRDLTPAYVPDDFLVDGWSEDLLERDSGSSFFGLESWCSIVYKFDGLYPASLTVSSYKTLFMMNEDDLREKTMDAIVEASGHGILVDNSSELSGERFLKNGHSTMYIIYYGNDTSKTPVESITVIGEVWNCGVSGKSIVCIGIAQVTDNLNNNTAVNTTSWSKIVGDENGVIDDLVDGDGLIYNIICH